MNNFNLIGTMVKDIELKNYNGKTRGLIRIAVNKEYRNANGEYESNFFNISLWGNNADFISRFAPKGTTIAVSGRLDSYTKRDEDGNSLGDVTSLEGTSVEIVKKAKSQQEQDNGTFNYDQKVSQNQSTIQQPTFQNNYPTNEDEVNDDDLPF